MNETNELAQRIDATISDGGSMTYNTVLGALAQVVSAYIYQLVVDSEEFVTREAVHEEAAHFQAVVDNCIDHAFKTLQEQADALQAEASEG